MSCADFECDGECGADFDDDWYDDMLVYVKEEPDCGACNDSGVVLREGGRRCHSCRPTRLESWRSGLKWRYREWKFRRNHGDSNAYIDEPPF